MIMTWKFVVMADNQDNTRASITGVNNQVAQLAGYIAAEKPELVICVGDMTSGKNVQPPTPEQPTISGDYAAEIKNWQAAMRAVYDAGIPVYVVRGNHDFSPKNQVPPARLHAAYLEAFAKNMPQNGPKLERGFTFSFIPDGRRAKFILLDEFTNTAKGHVLDEQGVTTGKIHLDIGWLQNELKDASDNGYFVFVFSHSPAYPVTHSQEPLPYNLYNQTVLRDEFWQSMENKITAYFCGHIHLYCRGIANGIPQFIVGTGGGEYSQFEKRNVDSTLQDVFPTVDVTKDEMLHGYLVVTVDEDNEIITYEQKLINPDGSVYNAQQPCPRDIDGPPFPRVAKSTK
jgi:predicted phosphodiesterase